MDGHVRYTSANSSDMVRGIAIYTQWTPNGKWHMHYLIVHTL